MIVAQHHVPYRFVGDRPDARDHLVGHLGRRLGINHHDAAIADDDASVWIALRGEGVKSRPDLGE